MGRIKRYYSALSRYHKSGGFGIHSPFAFYFVTKVLRERLPFYEYEKIEKRRRILINDLRGVVRHPRIISSKNAKLLFRVVNYFNPTDMLQIGSNYGVSLASTLSVSSKSHTEFYDANLTKYHATQSILKEYKDRINSHKYATQAITAYRHIVAEKGIVPFILINNVEVDDYEIVAKYLQTVIETGGIVIMRNLANLSLMKRLWHECSDSATFGMSFSNEKIAFLVMNPKLQRQDFLLWF